MTNKELISRIHTVHTTQHQNKNNSIKKWAEELNRHFSKEGIQMVDMKRWSTLLTIREMQTKTTVRYYLIPIMGIIKKNTNNKCWQGCRGKGVLVHCRWECKLVQPLWRTLQSFLQKVKIELQSLWSHRKLPYDLTTPLRSIYLKKMKIRFWKDTCTPVCIAALITVDKVWKQPQWSSADKWIKMPHTHTHTE